MGTLTPEYRWLLPAALVGDPDADRPMRRSTRDWVVDTVCFILGFGFTVLATVDLLGQNPSFVQEWAGTPRWMIWLDFATGTLFSVALWWRRRWPVHLTLAAQIPGLYSVAGSIALLILLFTVSVHRRFGVTAVFVCLSAVGGLIFSVVRPETDGTYWASYVWGMVFVVITVLWGMVVRSRRQLVVSLRDRAERAENEQQLRVAQARVLERTRIAREMHDVLAHRISLLSLHAGALEVRPDAAPAEVAGAAAVIRASAHQALQDLREVIGVLRDGESSGDAAPERPQPTLAQLTALAEESRAAGVRVRLDLHLPSVPVPDLTGRTAYRIVQEGLTNARKHAPGTTVTVAVGGAPGTGLTIDIRNPWPVAGGSAAVLPGAGTGLVGLAERATLAGGRLTHGVSGGDFTLTAWLPWPESRTDDDG